MQASQDTVRAAVLKAFPAAKLCRDTAEEICVSFPEHVMADQDIDEAIDAIRAALPDGATAEEEPGALLSITW